MRGFLNQGDAAGCGQLSGGSGAQESLAAAVLDEEQVVSERQFVARIGLHIEDREVDRTVGGAHHFALRQAVANLKSGEAGGSGGALQMRRAGRAKPAAPIRAPGFPHPDSQE